MKNGDEWVLSTFFFSLAHVTGIEELQELSPLYLRFLPH
jgi:hypothetical protein